MRRTLTLVVALAAVLAALPAAAPAASVPAAATYLQRSLDARGCAREPGGIASANLTAWVALGLVAAGRDASRAASCLEAHTRHLSRLTDYEIVALALVAAGRDPRRAGGHDLVAAIRGFQRGGRIGTTVASNQFGILALSAARAPIPAGARRTLLADQRADGSWPVAAGGPGDSNLTASGIDAAVAAGLSRSSAAVRLGARALRRFRAGGGYRLAAGAPPDAQSTAWALQGLAGAGWTDADARAWLGRLQSRDGSFAYQPGVRATPVWVTAQAVLGLTGRAFPLRP